MLSSSRLPRRQTCKGDFTSPSFLFVFRSDAKSRALLRYYSNIIASPNPSVVASPK